MPLVAGLDRTVGLHHELFQLGVREVRHDLGDGLSDGLLVFCGQHCCGHKDSISRDNIFAAEDDFRTGRDPIGY